MALSENKGLKILLIEDKLGDQALIKNYLQEEFPKLDLDIASNFMESTVYLEQKLQSYKIILLDLSLPDIEPGELLKKMILLAPNTPVIILTAHSDIHLAIQALTLGYTDYLLKDEINSKSLRKSIIHAFERKHLDQQLKLSVERYQQLFQLNPQPIWVINSQTGDFLEINKAALKKYGYSKSEFLEMKIQDIDENYNKSKLKVHLRTNEILKNGNLHQHRLKDGLTIQVKLYGNFIDYQGTEAILLMAIDSTETESYIRQIEHQNQQLKDIAWEQSHLVRAPLSRMMGIINRLEEKHLKYMEGLNEEYSFLIKNVLSSAHEIDGVIKSIVKKTSERQK